MFKSLKTSWERKNKDDKKRIGRSQNTRLGGEFNKNRGLEIKGSCSFKLRQDEPTGKDYGNELEKNKDELDQKFDHLIGIWGQGRVKHGNWGFWTRGFCLKFPENFGEKSL